MKDDVPEDVKKRRLQEIITTFYSHVGERHRRLVGTHQLVLVEGVRAATLTLSRLCCVVVQRSFSSRPLRLVRGVRVSWLDVLMAM